MRAGTLDRIITVQTYDPGAPDEYGSVTPGWGEARTLRAQILQGATEEFLHGAGERGQEAIVFRTRFVSGITTGHRIGFEGRFFDLKEVKVIGRREGLELRAVAAEA